MVNGVIIIYKERGWTSFDVVARLRTIFHQKKIGHTGTLDPDAEGVLPVCLGKATHLVEELSHGTKSYRCTMLLGRTTDTQDISGTTIAESVVEVTEEQVRNAVLSFVGKQLQIPPMYSALKVGGKKLVDLARKGIEVERKPREVEFSEIHVLEVNLPERERHESTDGYPAAGRQESADCHNDADCHESVNRPDESGLMLPAAEPTVTFEVTCSHGTYIRTLCHDIGQRLGCGACMKELLRTRVEEFSLDQALTLKEVETLKSEEDARNEIRTEPYSFIIPIDHFYASYPAYTVSQAFLPRALAGNPIPMSEISSGICACARAGRSDSSVPTNVMADSEGARVYTSDGTFVGVYRHRQDGFALVKYYYENPE